MLCDVCTDASSGAETRETGPPATCFIDNISLRTVEHILTMGELNALDMSTRLDANLELVHVHAADDLHLTPWSRS